jgi:PST family polysaccharide transporter
MVSASAAPTGRGSMTGTHSVTESGRDRRSALGEQVLTALKWNYLGAAVRVLSQFVIGIVLARVLGPEPFGLVALALLVIGLGSLVADLGFGSALVQRKELGEREVRFAFTLLALTGLGLTACVALSADPIATFFRRPDAAIVIRALSVLFAVNALGQTSASLLRRKLDLRSVQVAQIASYLGAYLLIGVPLAFAGAGVWSLVAASIAQACASTAVLYSQVRHPLRPALSHPGPPLIGFGAKVLGSNLANYTISNFDAAVVGRVFGATDLGLYNRSMQLVSVPMNALTLNLLSVLLPAYARVQDDRETLRRTYLASLAVMGGICLPVFAALAAVSETVIVGLYGGLWASAAPVFVPLSLAMPLNALLALGGPVLTGTGRPGLELRVQLVAATVMIVCLLVVSRLSLVAVAWAVLAVFILRFALITHATVRFVAASWRDVARVLLGPAALAVIASAGSLGADLLLRGAAIPASGRLFVDGLAGAACMAAGFALLRRHLVSGEVRWLAGRFGGRLARIARRVAADGA